MHVTALHVVMSDNAAPGPMCTLRRNLGHLLETPLLLRMQRGNLGFGLYESVGTVWLRLHLSGRTEQASMRHGVARSA